MTENKKDYFMNVKNFIKGGSDVFKEKMREKINTISEKIKNYKPIQSPRNGRKIQYEKKNNGKESIFTVEEDEDSKVYNYNLDEEDDIEYDDDDEETIDTMKPQQTSEIEKENNIEEKKLVFKETNKISHSNNFISKGIFSDVPEYEENIDSDFVCHRIYMKDSLMDLENLPFVKCTKYKPKNKLMFFVGFGKNNKIESKYVLVFDEQFLYIIKDLMIDNMNPFIKKINKHYDLKKLSNINIKNLDNGRVSICLTFTYLHTSNEVEYESKVKEFIFENEQSLKFFTYLKFYLKKLSLPLLFNNNN